MAVEFIRLWVIRPELPHLRLRGGVIIRSDGIADFLGDAADNAEIISQILDRCRFEAPFQRARPEDLTEAKAVGLLVDTLRIGEERVIGPLLLRADRPPAVGGAIHPAFAAAAHRVLQRFATSRAAYSLAHAA